jgi:hypothetical protein
MAIAAMLVPAAAVPATAGVAHHHGPTIKFAKKEKVYSSHKATMWIKCLGKKGSKKACKGTIKQTMIMQGKKRTLSKQHFSIKPNRKVVIHLHLTKWGKKELKELLTSPWAPGKCAVKAKAHQGNSGTKTSTGMIGYVIKG